MAVRPSLRSTARPEAATALFTERALAATPGWSATADEAAAVADVCERVGRLPLAAILFARLGAFAGPVPLDAVEAVGAADALVALEALVTSRCARVESAASAGGSRCRRRCATSAAPSWRLRPSTTSAALATSRLAVARLSRVWFAVNEAIIDGCRIDGDPPSAALGGRPRRGALSSAGRRARPGPRPPPPRRADEYGDRDGRRTRHDGDRDPAATPTRWSWRPMNRRRTVAPAILGPQAGVPRDRSRPARLAGLDADGQESCRDRA